MTTIVTPPTRIPRGPNPKEIECKGCGAVLSYTEADIDRYSGTDRSGGPDGYERIRCPVPGCGSYVYIRSW